MTVKQYDRKLSLIVGKQAGGNAVDFSAFKVRFQVRRGDMQTPNSADIRIFNLAPETARRATKEFTRVVLQAGYDGNFGLIFDGTIKQARIGRLDAKDSYLDITAADGDDLYNFAAMSVSLAAGAEPTDAVQAFVKSMAEQAAKRSGLSVEEEEKRIKGYVPDLSTNGATRGRVYYGMARDELREFAECNDLLWSIQNGQLVFIPQTSYIPGSIPLISPETGLIGVPEQTQNGIEIRVLLNPAIRIGQLVRLDSTVNLVRIGLDVQSQAQNLNQERIIKTNADGLYYVMAADHDGDTRGGPWYTDLTCLAVDAEVRMDEARRGAIVPEAASIRRY